MYLRKDTLITITDECPRYAGRFGRIESIQIDDETFDPVIFVSLFCADSQFRLLPFFKHQIERRPLMTAAQYEQHMLMELELAA